MMSWPVLRESCAVLFAVGMTQILTYVCDCEHISGVRLCDYRYAVGPA